VYWRSVEFYLTYRSYEKLLEYQSRLESNLQKIQEIKNQNQTLNDFPALYGYITFATIKSKLKYLEEYQLKVDNIFSELPDKYKLNGTVLQFGPANDPRDLNYRYLLKENGWFRKAKLTLKLLSVVAFSLFGIVILAQIYTVPNQYNCQLGSNLTQSGEESCGCMGLFKNLANLYRSFYIGQDVLIIS
jgi:hypothetical protein